MTLHNSTNTKRMRGQQFIHITFHDKIPGGLHLASDLLQPSRGNPGRRVVRVGFSHRFQQQPRLLDVVDVTAVCWYHGLQVGEVTLGVHHCLTSYAKIMKYAKKKIDVLKRQTKLFNKKNEITSRGIML